MLWSSMCHLYRKLNKHNNVVLTSRQTYDNTLRHCSKDKWVQVGENSDLEKFWFNLKSWYQIAIRSNATLPFLFCFCFPCIQWWRWYLVEPYRHLMMMRFIPQIVTQKLSGIRLIKQSLPSEILHFIQKIVIGCAPGIHSGMGEEMTNHLFF